MPRYDFERPALIEDRFARTLIGSGKERSDHDGVRAGSERLGDIAGELDAAVGDQRNVGFACRFGASS